MKNKTNDTTLHTFGTITNIRSKNRKNWHMYFNEKKIGDVYSILKKRVKQGLLTIPLISSTLTTTCHLKQLNIKGTMALGIQAWDRYTTMAGLNMFIVLLPSDNWICNDKTYINKQLKRKTCTDSFRLKKDHTLSQTRMTIYKWTA